MQPIIRVKNVSKQYRLGATQRSYDTLRDTLAATMRAPFRRRKRETGKEETIWALRDVNFEVTPGEVVGIIGRNGAGKSTLLKVLSRITEPTSGRVELYGRVGSLLEVGTGFHPELTGRENIFLNGVIMGMRREEIERKFDEIVAFSEVSKFLDTPVKRYSSGMYIRLAFAVAAHLEPEILIVDEVLAVGDTRFQRKCLDKMQDVNRLGRTVLFVSHNMAAVTRLCQRAILMDEGTVLVDGISSQVVSSYLGNGAATGALREWPVLERSPGDDTVRLRAVRIRTEDGDLADVVDIRKGALIEIEYDILKPGKRLSPVIICNNESGVCIFSSAGVAEEFVQNQDISFVGRCFSSCLIPGNLLAEGTVSVTVSVNAILDGNAAHAIERDAISFQTVDSLDGGSARGLYGGPVLGVVRPLLKWTSRRVAAPLNSESLLA
jgi:lipopolysaccharide transport system ATP-binding protein